MSEETINKSTEEPTSGSKESQTGKFPSMMDAIRAAMAETPEPEDSKQEVPKKQEKKTDEKEAVLDQKPDVSKASEKAQEKAKPSESKPDEAEKESEKPPEKETGVGQLRKAYEQRKREMEKLERELATLREKAAKSVDEETIANLARERDEALEIVKRVDRQRHPAFKTEFVEPLNKLISRAKNYVPQEAQGLIETILKEKDSPNRIEAIERVTEGLSPARQAEILRIAENAADLVERREKALEESNGWFEEQSRIEREKQRHKYLQEKEKWQEDFEEVGREAEETLPMFRYTGDDANDRRVIERTEKVKAILFGENSRRSQVEAAFAAVAALETIPLLARANTEIAAKDAQIAKMEQELEGLRTKRLSTSSGQAKSQGRPSMMEAIKATLAGETS